MAEYDVPEVAVVCHSRKFVLAVLSEKPYRSRLSDHLCKQLMDLDEHMFPKFIRAIDAFDCGKPITKGPKPFRFDGVLSGYSHFHYLQPDWYEKNFAIAFGLDIKTPLDTAIEKVADSILGGRFAGGVDEAVRKFSERISNGKLTGEWVVYRSTPEGPRYLALHDHPKGDLAAEWRLRELLDSL